MENSELNKSNPKESKMQSASAQEIAACDPIDHIAIPVTDLSGTVDYYKETFKCKVLYQDDTWAFLQFNNIKLAFVVPEQHPPHIAFIHKEAESFGPLKLHRDGTRSIYIKDPSGNTLEIMAPY